MYLDTFKKLSNDTKIVFSLPLKEYVQLVNFEILKKNSDFFIANNNFLEKTPLV